uniref:PspA/IM30 family protein n=1 Tax=Hemiselmis andersenii TaxID=464988 RepID=A0A6T8KYZ8_HEMAN
MPSSKAAIALLSLAGAAEAFSPSASPFLPSAARPALAASSAFTPALRISSSPSTGMRRGGVAPVQMNLGERFVRLVKANVNEILTKGEDPEKMLNQIVEDMQKELIEFRQTYAEVAAGQKRMQKQQQQAEGLAEEWLKRAKLALEKGDEEAARAALERKNQQEEVSNGLKSQIAAQEKSVESLFQNMKTLEAKISEAKSKKEQLKARAQTAKVSTKVNDMLSRTSKSGAMQAFEAMEDKVDKLEAEAEVSLELSGSDASLEDRFKKLEAGSKVEDELSALKGMIGGSDKPKILEADVKKDPKVEAELKNLKDLM